MQEERYSPKCLGEASRRLFGAPTIRRGAVPETTITINREQRDGLYELVRNHLGSVGDLWDALAKAATLGLEFSEDFELLEDIGWGEDEGRESFELTMPPHDLMEALKRLHGEAERVLLESGTERESREADAETNARFQLGLDTCEEVLIGLDEREGERA
jgi:hypothetical protein